jgi:ribonuclease P protein component
VYNEGRSWIHPLLVLVARPNDLDFTRVAFVAGRRVGKAVDRNRAKRLMREAARSVYPRVDPGWDIVLVARRRILSAKEPVVEASLATVARQAGLVGTERDFAALTAEEKGEG